MSFPETPSESPMEEEEDSDKDSFPDFNDSSDDESMDLNEEVQEDNEDLEQTESRSKKQTYLRNELQKTLQKYEIAEEQFGGYIILKYPQNISIRGQVYKPRGRPGRSRDIFLKEIDEFLELTEESRKDVIGKIRRIFPGKYDHELNLVKLSKAISNLIKTEGHTQAGLARFVNRLRQFINKLILNPHSCVIAPANQETYNLLLLWTKCSKSERRKLMKKGGSDEDEDEPRPAQKRPRFSRKIVEYLKKYFNEKSSSPDFEESERLSRKTGLTETQVRDWFKCQRKKTRKLQ